MGDIVQAICFCALTLRAWWLARRWGSVWALSCPS